VYACWFVAAMNTHKLSLLLLISENVHSMGFFLHCQSQGLDLCSSVVDESRSALTRALCLTVQNWSNMRVDGNSQRAAVNSIIISVACYLHAAQSLISCGLLAALAAGADFALSTSHA